MLSPEKNIAAMSGLIAKANEKTGESATDLTTAVNGLIAGFGQGGSGGGAIDFANIEEVDSIANPTASSPTAVRYDGEIYLLIKE